MGLVSLLFSFHGRIGRGQYWLGTTLVFVGFVMSVVLLGVVLRPQEEFTKTSESLARLVTYLLSVVGPPLLLAGWSNHALMVKRLHDRGRTGWIAAGHAGLAVLILLIVFGSMGSPQALAGAVLLTTPLSLFLWIAQIVLLIDLGFLPSKGPNKYGDGPGSTGGAPSPGKGPGLDAPAGVASSLFGAQSAMDRAIADQARRASMAPAPKPAMAAAAAPGGGAPSFGRRAR